MRVAAQLAKKPRNFHSKLCRLHLRHKSITNRSHDFSYRSGISSAARCAFCIFIAHQPPAHHQNQKLMHTKNRITHKHEHGNRAPTRSAGVEHVRSSTLSTLIRLLGTQSASVVASSICNVRSPSASLLARRCTNVKRNQKAWCQAHYRSQLQGSTPASSRQHLLSSQDTAPRRCKNHLHQLGRANKACDANVACA